jgi:phenylalanyl-tRNA synthetase beta chain
LKLAVRNELPELVPRFSAVAIKDIKVEESPVWLKVRLSSVGVRPINNIVDITNYLMIETGQPLHAYDYDKVKTGVLGARKAKDGEKLMLLGGKKIKLEKDCIVITDGENPIGLAGVMGGAGTDVDKKTKNIILEVANFDMNTTRRTAMRYGLFTDASTRFSKNQSPRQTRTVLVKAVSDIKRIAGGRAASPIVDDNHYIAVVKPVKVSVGFINSRLGLGLKAGEAARLLSNVEFKVSTSGQNLEVTPPFWRTDIEIPEDIVEEIGRLYGYDRLPVVLPEHDLTPAPNDELLSFKRRLRAILASAGGQEVLNYSFVHGNLLEKAGQNKTKAYKLANALSPNSQYYRLSLTPSLLDKVHPNQKLGFKEFALFEINKTHIKPYKDTLDKDLPREFEMLGFVFASSQKFIKTNGSPMYHVRTFLDYLSKELGIKFSYKILPQSNKSAVVAPFEHSRTAEICDADSKIPIGIVGEYRDSLVQGLKLPKFCAGFEIDIEQLLKIIPTQQSYRPLNRYPELEQDFCLRAPAKHTYAELTDFMEKQLRLESQVHGYSAEIWPLDIYKRQGDKNHKQTTWRIILWHPDRTLTTAESNNLLEKIAASAKKELNAERL